MPAESATWPRRISSGLENFDTVERRPTLPPGSAGPAAVGARTASNKGRRPMHIISRRAVLAGAGAITAAAIDPLAGIDPLGRMSAARAAAPAVGTQAPGFYRAKLGDFEITQISDGAATFPMPDGWVRNIAKDQALAHAAAVHMPEGKVNVPFNPIVINT